MGLGIRAPVAGDPPGLLYDGESAIWRPHLDDRERGLMLYLAAAYALLERSGLALSRVDAMLLAMEVAVPAASVGMVDLGELAERQPWVPVWALADWVLRLAIGQ
jgi:hypothetical protein